MISAWGAVLNQQRWVIFVAGIVVTAIAGVWGVGVFGSLSNGGFDDPDSESSQVEDVQGNAFGRSAADVVVVYSSPDLAVSQPAFADAVTLTIDTLPDDAVVSAASFFGTHERSFVSPDGHSTYVAITLAGEDQNELSDSYSAIEDRLDAPGLDTAVGGPWAVFGDVNTQVSEDIARAESISLPLVFLLSIVIFGSVVSALLPVLVGVAAIVGALAIVRVITLFTDVSIFSINVISLLGLGLAIDYALFIVTRFREEMARDGAGRASTGRALVATMQTAGRTVMFSGLTVAAALASLLLFPQGFLRSMGYGGMAAVLVAMVAALTILPALLAILGPGVDRGRVRSRGSAGRVGGHGLWARLAHNVMARPLRYIVAITVVLVALGTPFLSVQWSSVDYRTLPADAPSRVATEHFIDEFPQASGSSASVLVEGGDTASVRAYGRELAEVAGVADVRTTGSTDVDGQPLTRLDAVWPGNAQAPDSRRIVEDIRAVPAPPAAAVLVGGESAQTVDLLASLGSTLPWMGLFVVIVMLVLLFLAFGSLVLPVKAVVMNAISICASFGVVTWIFADGHLSGLLGFASTGTLDATQPILMLAILFGLSMDYEVFLLSRIREEWDRGHDNTTATATGLQRSGGIITSAALLLIVVIGGFATSGIVFIKMIGIGMFVAIAIDATVVRALLVPATMRLLGRVNWWAPRPLRQWWERHGLREEPKAILAP